ncbi:hypothetical protein TNIN_281281 [Trichonephila inaurata madagascariensis]|uniref:Uncharacterized protein n=1 Tax=Trichonephila inaurata madagascariensis TaxID=2747483 RepID=A0A8X6YCK4_9ARAC|nr:hypothetical protein TNIN_281281 [Trichonephila inaurata madagascariensis]
MPWTCRTAGRVIEIADKASMRLMLKKELTDQTSFLVLYLAQLEADLQHDVSDRRRGIVDLVGLQAVGMRKAKRGNFPRRGGRML